jgi:hypothetical protein
VVPFIVGALKLGVVQSALKKSNKLKSYKIIIKATYKTTTKLMNTYLYLMIKNDDW